jgi:methylase of polypeptide subunit release factors
VARLTESEDHASPEPRISGGAHSSVTFGGLHIIGAPSVLPPRDWTTAQSLWAAELLQSRPEGPILELFTGSGQIGLLAAHLTGRPLVAVDINPDAANCARENAIRAGIAHLVDIRCADIESALTAADSFPLIIADPPWVPHHRLNDYPQDPPLAIDGGKDGLQLARSCLRVIEKHLQPGGAALLQLGSREQVDQLWRELSSEAGALVITEHRGFPGRGNLLLLEPTAAR